MPAFAQAVYTAYKNRNTIKRVVVWLLIIVGSAIFFVYIILVTLLTVISGTGKISDNNEQSGYVEFQDFSYKTVFGDTWYEYNHPYIFPTLGVLTQGVILDSTAKVGQQHIAWDIADVTTRTTEVKAFSTGTVVSIKDNILHNTTRRWKFCDDPGGICWYEVSQAADVQYACGYEITIQHPDSLSTQYCHLASWPIVKVGQPVSVGQVIGYQGSTGWATGKHLHFALWRDGEAIDPSYAFTQTSLSNWQTP